MDQLYRFHFKDVAIRGMWVQLTGVWHSALAEGSYLDPTNILLGKLLASIALIANSIKHEGRVTLHAVGDGPVKTAFVECNNQENLRGIIRRNEDTEFFVDSSMTFKELMGQGQLALSLQFKNGNPYQGLVGIQYDELEANLESYFEISEQLPTALVLATQDETVTGCLLQRLPSKEQASDFDLAMAEAEWSRVLSLFRTVKEKEVANVPITELLSNVFRQDSIYVDDPKFMRFHCTCSQERCVQALKTLEKGELQELLEEQTQLSIQCEFCGRSYRVDAEAILTGLAV